MASQDDMLAQANGINANLAKLVSVMQTRFALGAFTGVFTLTASASLTVPDINVVSSSTILIMPFNASAATLQGSAKSLYVSARNAGVSFVVTTASGVAATGGELFKYVIVNTG